MQVASIISNHRFVQCCRDDLLSGYLHTFHMLSGKQEIISVTYSCVLYTYAKKLTFFKERRCLPWHILMEEDDYVLTLTNTSSYLVFLLAYNQFALHNNLYYCNTIKNALKQIIYIGS